MERLSFWLLFTAAALLAFFASTLVHAGAPQRPVNLLFLMTDQQRWDALGCAGNKVLETANLDRMAREGARFTSFYSSCPVCSPARTTILTGRSVGSHKVTDNKEITRDDLPDLVTFDQILLRSGYSGEYHGKYHSPYKMALDYSHPVRWVNGPRPPGSKADMNEGQAFGAYIEAHVPARPLKPGELLANFYGRPYTPDPIDGGYGMTQEQVEKLLRAGKDKRGELTVGQGFTYGCLDVPPEHTLTAWTAKEGLEGLERLRKMGGPFTLTISIGPPHPPMAVAKPYYGMYPAATIPAPASLNDRSENSPYMRRQSKDADPYRDPEKVRQMISDYYGLVAEVDDWIGKILKRLDQLGLAQNTLVVFTSDHGEMLGDHGMNSKMAFYEGAAHIPLLMRLPGVIPAGTVVKTPAAQIDLFATILDYLGQPGHASEGRSLRPLIEGKDDGEARIAVSEWHSTHFPGFMVFDGRWKLMFGQTADAKSLDALYDLQNDPNEITNLIGRNPERQKHCAEAERMKALLVDWLARVKSPYLEGVKARPITRQQTATAVLAP
ncbi:MAG TPA: sulfatase-like hydrolase/transferase [Verrucomicrobiae bacterium]|nr:sulfatase-like hydrolase/transferase [Verrucomicrobiae bacterium]